MARTKRNKPGSKRRQDSKSVKSTAKASIRQDATTMDPAGDKERRPSKKAKTFHDKDHLNLKHATSAPQQHDEAPEMLPEQTETDNAVAAELSGHHTDPFLSKTHKVMEMRVISSSQINQKVTQILSLLATFSFVNLDAKPVMVLVRADGTVVNKAISIVEIAKAELSKQGAKWYQYSMVKLHTVELPLRNSDRDKKSGRTISEWENEQAKSRGGNMAGIGLSTDTAAADALPVEMDQGGDEAEEEAFEAMGQAFNSVQGPELSMQDQSGRAQTVPRLVLLLTRVRCEQARTRYGLVFSFKVNHCLTDCQLQRANECHEMTCCPLVRHSTSNELQSGPWLKGRRYCAGLARHAGKQCFHNS